MLRTFIIAMLMATLSPSVIAANCKLPSDTTESILSYNACKRSFLFGGSVCSSLLERIEDSLNSASTYEMNGGISQRLCAKSFDDGQPSIELCDDASENRQLHEKQIRYTADLATIYAAGCK